MKRYRGRSKWNIVRVSAAVFCVLASLQRSNSAQVPEIVRLVKATGWRADLGRICQEVCLAPHEWDCIFKLISVQEVVGRGDPRGFNVPDAALEAPYVLIFHLGPPVGKFFIAAPQGKMLSTFTRTQGKGYEPVPNDAVRNELSADRTYWKGNFDRMRTGIESESSRSR